MPSLDIYSRDGGKKVRDLIVSFFSTFLMNPTPTQPFYLISPWLSDFVLFDNRFGEYRHIFRSGLQVAESPKIMFSEALAEIAAYSMVRIATWPDIKSKTFVSKLKTVNNLEARFETAERDHQKGLLCELFYLEGSMNFTFSGLYINREKVTCTAGYDKEGRQKISAAYIEFDRIWDNLCHRTVST